MMPGWSRFRGVSGPDPERDVEAELAFHVEMLERDLIRRGVSPEQAREQALRRFGDYGAARAECLTIDERQGRRMGRAQVVTEIVQDGRYALRSLSRRPGFTAVAVLTLALGIGATSAIFSVVNGVLLKGLPYANAERAHVLHMVYPDGTEYSSLSAPDFMSVAAGSRVFEHTVAMTGRVGTLQELGDPREVRTAYLSRGFMEGLGMRLTRGRTFTAEEHVVGSGAVAILSHGFWQREFGGADDAVGRSVGVSGRQFTVVGILAAGQDVDGEWDVYAPLEYDETFDATTALGRRGEYLSVLGIARPGVTPELVAADVSRVATELREQFPATNGNLSMTTKPLHEFVVGEVRRPLVILMGAVALVLLVACANVANLLLARASSRRTELAVRAALGAGRRRLLGQLLTESVVLGAVGGVVGLAVAWFGTRALVAAQPADIPRIENVGLDATVVLVTLGAALLTGLLFGALPALQASRGGMAGAIREGGRGAGGSGGRLRSGLIVVEMALAVMLLVGSGLLVRSFVQMTRVDPGFEPGGAVSFRMVMNGDRYPDGQSIRSFVDETMARLAAAPGVRAAGGASHLPFGGVGMILSFSVVDAPPPPEHINREIAVTRITPGYFSAIGARIVSGRDVVAADRSDAPQVAVINEAAARFWFAGEDAVGRRIELDGEYEVVGVVSDVMQGSPAEPVVPMAYVPFSQLTGRTLLVVARTAADPMAMAPGLRSLIRQADPGMPISDFQPLRQVASEAVARPRFYMALLTLFAAIALALAAIGVFGVMSYNVTQRTREISIRIALGAQGSQVVRMVVGHSLALAGIGLLAGVAGAVTLGRVLQSQLYGVGVLDPLALGVAATVLVVAALLASWLPARRAAALDPGTALRAD